jgi:ABC-type branched-subunit amino acid transport system substrate-binding protein
MRCLVDGVFAATDFPADALTLVKQLRELGFKGTPITFIDVDNKNIEKFGATAEGTFAPGIAPSAFSSSFTKRYKEKFNADPDYVSALGYDITKNVVNALEANPGKSADVAVRSYTYTNPAIGDFHFLEDRTVTYYLDLQMVRDGAYVKAAY